MNSCISSGVLRDGAVVSALSFVAEGGVSHLVAGTLSAVTPSAEETPTVTLPSDSRVSFPCPASTLPLKLLSSPVALSRASSVLGSIAPLHGNPFCVWNASIARVFSSTEAVSETQRQSYICPIVTPS